MNRSGDLRTPHIAVHLPRADVQAPAVPCVPIGAGRVPRYGSRPSAQNVLMLLRPCTLCAFQVFRSGRRVRHRSPPSRNSCKRAPALPRQIHLFSATTSSPRTCSCHSQEYAGRSATRARCPTSSRSASSDTSLSRVNGGGTMLHRKRPFVPDAPLAPLNVELAVSVFGNRHLHLTFPSRRLTTKISRGQAA